MIFQKSPGGDRLVPWRVFFLKKNTSAHFATSKPGVLAEILLEMPPFLARSMEAIQAPDFSQSARSLFRFDCDIVNRNAHRNTRWWF